MAIKILVNPFEAPTTSQKHELGIIITDPRGSQGAKTYQDVLPVSGTDATPTALTIRKPEYNHAPDAEFQYVKNVDTDAIVAGHAVMYNTSPTNQPAAVEFGNGTDRPIAGIAVRTIAAGSFGWIQVKGLVPVPSTTSNSDAELRGGVRVSPTNLATGSILGLSATDGVLQARSVTTDATNLTGLTVALVGRRIYTLKTAVNLATSGGTDGRAEAYIF